jgi:hypothetical protein
VTVAGVVAAEAQPAPSLADALRADRVEQAAAVLPSSRQVVSVAVYVRREETWIGDTRREFGTIPNKRLYVHEGAPFYPELLVVRLLERAGWGAAWRKTWNGVAYWRDVNETVEPGPLAMSIVGQIARQAGYEGSWDIIAWRDRELRMLASRPAGGQRVSAYMADWLDAAMRMGVPSGCFAVVEHEAPRLQPKRRR